MAEEYYQGNATCPIAKRSESVPTLVSIPLTKLLLDLVGLPGDGGDGAANIKGGGGGGKLAGADHNDVAAGRVLHAKGTHDHLGVEFEELKRVFRCAGTAD